MIRDKSLEVYYHGMQVGTLARMPDKRVAFQYTDDWIRHGFSISPLSLPLGNEVFVPASDSRAVFHGLFGVFADSLPDSWGELLLDRYLSSVGIDPSSITVLDRLAYVGTSGMGALEYVPSKNTDFNIETAGMNYDEIAGECGKLLSSKTSDKLDILYELGGSSGGTRPKILLREDGTERIIKFPAREDPAISGKREYDYSICAGKCGIDMTKTWLVDSKVCEGYFETERFDRKGDLKIMTATAAGLLEADFRAPSCDYRTFMKLVQVLTKDNDHDTEQMYRVMCFNVLTHNRDDHAKNFSFMFTEDKGWRLAPAYDLTYSDTYFGEHTTSVNGKGRDITDDDLVRIGTEGGLSGNKCRQILEHIRIQTETLSEYLSGRYLPKGGRTDMKNRIKEITGKK